MTESSKKRPIGRITLYDVRLSFCESLWTPKAFRGRGGNEGGGGNQRARRKSNFLLEKEAWKAGDIECKWKGERQPFTPKLWQELKLACIAEKIGEREARKLIGKIKPDCLAIRNGDLETWDGYEGHVYVSASNKRKVQVKDRDLSPLEEEDGKPYAGCYVNVVLTFWFQKAGQTQDGDPLSNAIWCSLEVVQFLRDGDAFGATEVDPEEEGLEDQSDEFHEDPDDGGTDDGDDDGGADGLL